MNFLISTAYAAGTATTAGDTQDFFSRLIEIAVNAAIIIAILVVFLIIARMTIARIVRRIRQGEEDNEGNRSIEVIVSRLTYLISGIIALAIGLGITNTFGQLGWLFGALGLGIGFALQTIIGNFVAGLALLIQRKVRIGDFVEISDFRGIITTIGTRSVTLHDFDGTEVLIPNLEFFNKYVRIYTANTFRRIFVEVGVGYDTDFAKAYAIIFEVLASHRDVEKEPKPDILCSGIGDSNVNLTVRWWIHSNLQWWTLQSTILQDIFVALDKSGIDISFNVTTLRVDNHQSDLLAGYFKK